MPITALALLLGTSAFARLVNVTIDDTHGDERTGRTPQYTSVHRWNARSAGEQCSTCAASPDGTQAFEKTWHDETTFPGQLPSNVSFTFNGSVLYVYCILANNIGLDNQGTRLAFYLDASPEPTQQFYHPPDLAADGFIYNQLVFKDDSLTDGEHSMLISNWADGNSGSLVLFDYAVYSTEEADPEPPNPGPDPAPPSTQSTPTPKPPDGDHSPGNANLGAIIGGSVAGAVVAVLLVLSVTALFLRRRHRRESAAAKAAEVAVAATRQGPGTQAAAIDPFYAYVRQSDTAWRTPQDKGRPPLPVGSSSTSSSGVTTSQSHSVDESAHFRTELERIREELERVRRIAEPPEYTHNRPGGDST
ncbi:hypothetical protein AURDEDRAFT_188621 [Auricularia subglabra TFB-10046 SS5]|nr:hypothetical protein AURDEDRAFT_188621 [Auricularia subglabra TFB-10046 SS5]